MRDVIKNQRVQIVGGPGARASARPAAPASPSPCAAGPRVRLLELEPGIQALEFTCGCGEVSLLEIELDLGNRKAA